MSAVLASDAAAPRVAGDPGVDLSDVQGNILRGYRKKRVRHLTAQVIDAGQARAWIAATCAAASDAGIGKSSQ